MRDGRIQSPYFFGYGSLVNARTHGYPDAQPASLDGWRRVWRQTNLRPRPFLTVEPCADTQIMGVIAAVPDANWQALDKREAVYDRQALSQGLHHRMHKPVTISAYVISPDKYPSPTNPHPILLSYLDVVVQGYWQMFGAVGAQHFFASTAGWDTSILNDRKSPIYPRAQTLTSQQTAFVDAEIARLGCPVLLP